MKIVVINLERSQDRRAFMREQLAAFGLEYEFLRGVDASRGEHLGVSRYDADAALWKLGHPLLPSEIGCFASHHLAWQRCAESGEPLLIMEDDAQLLDGFPAAVEMAERHVAAHRFIRLYAMFRRRARKVADLESGHQMIRYLKGPYGLQCYALSPEGAQVLLRHAQTWIDAVDTYVDQSWRHGLAGLAIVPFHIAHAGEGHVARAGEVAALPTTVGGVAGMAPRPVHRKLRRAATHLYYRLRRGWYNLSYSLKNG